MAVTRAQHVRLGLFILLGLGVFIGGLAILAGMKLGETRDRYTVRFSQTSISLSGLEVGSPVKYSGLRVGRVDAVRVAQDDVGIIEVVLTLDGGTPVAENSRANLGSMGITGLKYIELTRGSKAERIRDPGEVIPEGTSLIDDLSDQAGDIARKVQTTLDNVNALTGPDMKGKLSSILDRTDRTLAGLEATIEENRGSIKLLATKLATTADNIDALTEGLNGTLKRTDRLVADARPRLNRALEQGGDLLADLRGTGRKLDATLAATDQLLAHTDAVIGPDGLGKLMASLTRIIDRAQLLMLQTRENFVEAAAYLKDSSENMVTFTEKIRDDPSLLFLSDDADEGDLK
jgi:phospholipid/cholesterol/gamma-HCH transport system substrate-binding protein